MRQRTAWEWYEIYERLHRWYRRIVDKHMESDRRRYEGGATLFDEEGAT